MSSILRRVVESLSRHIVFRRNLPAPFQEASILVSGSCGLAYIFRRMKNVDPTLIRLVVEYVQEDMIVWDVGANLGLFAATASMQVGPNGRVVAFEPDPWLMSILKQSFGKSQSHFQNIELEQFAIAEATGQRNFGIARRSRSSNALVGYGSTQMGGARRVVQVQARTLDSFLDSSVPDLLKIDVEGAELEVLRGGKQTLADARPIVICEVSSDVTGEVTALFDSYNYRIFDGHYPREEAVMRSRAPWATVAVPAEKLTPFAEL